MRIASLALLLLAAVAAQAATVQLSWTDPQASVTWNVYRAAGACDPSNNTFGKINAAPVTVRNYSDPNIGPGQYCYYVTAENPVGESAASNTAQANVSPDAPSDLSITVEVAVTIKTNCGKVSAAVWKGSGLGGAPFGTPAADTQLGDACASLALKEPIRVSPVTVALER